MGDELTPAQILENEIAELKKKAEAGEDVAEALAAKEKELAALSASWDPEWYLYL